LSHPPLTDLYDSTNTSKTTPESKAETDLDTTIPVRCSTPLLQVIFKVFRSDQNGDRLGRGWTGSGGKSGQIMSGQIK